MHEVRGHPQRPELLELVLVSVGGPCRIHIADEQHILVTLRPEHRAISSGAPEGSKHPRRLADHTQHNPFASRLRRRKALTVPVELLEELPQPSILNVAPVLDDQLGGLGPRSPEPELPLDIAELVAFDGTGHFAKR
jgi:hypothetical protein